MPIYRLVLDGQEDCRDYTKLEDAYQEFVKARKRGVFSARIDAYSEIDHILMQTVHHYEQSA